MSKYRLVYDRYFTVQKGCEYNGKKIIGASIEFLFRFGDKDNNEILYNNGDECIAQERLLCSLDKENGVSLTVQKVMGDNISIMDVAPVKYLLDCFVGKADDVIKDCPKEIADTPVSNFIELSKEEFITFVKENWNAFGKYGTTQALNTSLRYEKTLVPIEF